MKKLFLVSSALVILWSHGAVAGKGALECHVNGWTSEVGHNGTPKNLHTAYSYYEKAQKKGHPAAEVAMKRVIGQMTPEQQETYNPDRCVPELPAEVWLPIIAQSGSLGICSLVSKQFNNITQDEMVWSLLAQRYSVEKREGIPLNHLVRVDYYMKKALLAWFEEKDDLHDSLHNQATRVGDGSALWFSIPGLLYWDLLKYVSGCKDMIEAQVAHGNLEAVLRKHEGLTFGCYGYQKAPEDARNLYEELEKHGNLEAFTKRQDEIRRDKFRECTSKEWKVLGTLIGQSLPSDTNKLKQRTLSLRELLR